MVATDSAIRMTWRSSSAGSTRSWLKVSSCPIDLAGRLVSTGLGSSPRARANRDVVHSTLPRRPTSVSPGNRRQIRHGAHAESCRRLAVAGPTPQSASTLMAVEKGKFDVGRDQDGRLVRRRARPGSRGFRGTRSQLGDHFRTPDANGAVEGELGPHPVSNPCAMVSGGPSLRIAPATSRNASSRPIGSTRGVILGQKAGGAHC